MEQERPSIPFSSQQAWEEWIRENHQTNDGIWLRIGKKGSPYPSVTYAEALDVALCYGWIDGQRYRYDEHYFLQRFTPRRARSIWSKVNTLKIADLTKQGRMQPAGLAQVEAAIADGRWDAAYDSLTTINSPEDFTVALAKNKKAQAFFNTLTRTERYSYLFRIQTCKNNEARVKKIAQLVEMLAEKKRFSQP
jgi:uncharacterized protein YdeI (YjbR/CyaY-like superfamily)